MRIPGGRLAGLVLLLAGLGVAAFLSLEMLRSGGGSPPATSGARQGGALYETHCAVCHGLQGKGDGAGARLIRQPIRDFSDPVAMRRVNDRFLFDIIKKGGSQFGRSNAMPAWGMKLSDEEIRGLVAYIRSLALQDASRPPGGKETP